MNYYNGGTYDLIVVGAGHAGIEAALAGARMGKKTLLMTLNPDSIGLMHVILLLVEQQKAI